MSKNTATAAIAEIETDIAADDAAAQVGAPTRGYTIQLVPPSIGEVATRAVVTGVCVYGAIMGLSWLAGKIAGAAAEA